MFILDSMHFPLRLIADLIDKGIENNDKVIDHLLFEDKLCHECNKATPSYRYCHEMYGGVFKQTYGWYINKQALEFGIAGERIDHSLCPREILDLVEIDPDSFLQRYQALQGQDYEKAREFEKAYRKQVKRIQKVVENEVRRKFGHKKIGETWTSETILYYIVKNLLSDKEIVRHYRPDFLEGLELDIYIPDLRLGIEYQGIQHYKPVEHWGGEEALEHNKLRDKRKRDLCVSLGIDLVYFRHDEELSNAIVKEKLERYL